MTRNWIEILIEQRGLNADCYESLNKIKIDEIEAVNIYTLEATNIDSEDVNLIIYDCSAKNAELNYNLFKCAIDRYALYQPTIISENWKRECEIYFACYKSIKNSGCKKNAKDCKDFENIFKEKISIYSDITDEIYFEVDSAGINYLEYGNDKVAPLSTNDEDAPPALKGYIYNIAFFELKKLFNVTGNQLFINNVRFRMNKKDFGVELKSNFEKYLKIALYQKFKKNKSKSNIIEKISEMLNVYDSTLKVEDVYLPENFWLYHNGITIFSNKIIRSYGNKIFINPKKVSVINGAQTLTYFFMAAEEVIRNFLCKIENLNEFDIGLLKEECDSALSKEELDNSLSKDCFNLDRLMDSVLRNIKVKTIIIQGESSFMRLITYGLNTQTPIYTETILANSGDAKKINSLLKGEIKILKDGEQYFGSRGYKLLDFVKNWMTIDKKPGGGKNFDKKNLKKELRDIFLFLKGEEGSKAEANRKEFIKKFRTIEDVYSWWKSSRSARVKEVGQNVSKKIISSYGKNYFSCFVINQLVNNPVLDNDRLNYLYENFEKQLIELTDGTIKVGDFKTDTLSKKMLNCELALSLLIPNFVANQKELLISLLNDSNQSVYDLPYTIRNYFDSINKPLPYFRVISLSAGKCKEAFPFSNLTFLELCDIELYGKGGWKSYDESLLKKEVNREYPILIIRKEDTLEKKDIITDINVIKICSFAKYNEQAKMVYNATVSAFKESDEHAFTKASDNLKFYIRANPKNAEDTFEFTNGHSITKMTFWASEKTVEELISASI